MDKLFWAKKHENDHHALILLADDIPANLMVMVGHLESHGYRVVVAQDGEEGVQRAIHTRPDLILLDAMMPVMDGFETCRRLKSIPDVQDIPVIFMTALTETERKLEAFAAGGVDYVVKPSQAEEVLARVHAHISLRKLRLAVDEQNKLLLEEIKHREQVEQDLSVAVQAAQESEGRYKLLVDSAPVAILMVQQGKVVYCNAVALQLFAAASLEEVASCRLPFLTQSDEAVQKKLPFGILSLPYEQSLVQLDGSEVDVEITRLQFTLQGESATQYILRDISESKRLNRVVQFQATHDALTGLPNRNLLMDRLNQMVAQAKRQNTEFVVCFIDLNRFKEVNDTFGHEAGDELLQVMSGRMNACLRETDTLARLGGDEFIALLADTTEQEEVALVLSRISKVVAEPVALKAQMVLISCCIGTAVFPRDGGTANELIRVADLSMYKQKTHRTR